MLVRGSNSVVIIRLDFCKCINHAKSSQIPACLAHSLTSMNAYLTAAEVQRYLLQIDVTGQAKQQSPKTTSMYR